MDVSDQYIYDLVKINPNMNDFLKLDVQSKKNVNIFSNDYLEKEHKLMDRYLKKLKHKKHLTFSERLLKDDLQQFSNLVDFPDIYFLISGRARGRPGAQAGQK